MSGVGLTAVEIARIKGVTVKTLRKHCREDLTNAGPKANAAVALALFKQATGTEGQKPNPIAGMFWLKCRAGWNDRPGTDLEGGKEGKKAARVEAARKVASSGRFKPAAPPRLATLNGAPVDTPPPEAKP